MDVKNTCEHAKTEISVNEKNFLWRMKIFVWEKIFVWKKIFFFFLSKNKDFKNYKFL